MAMDFDKWNKEFGGAEAVKELEEAAKNEFTELPDGTYRCMLEKLELGESKNGKPMVKGMFRIVEGSHTNQCLFYNQVFTRGFPQHKALEFLRSMQIFDESEIDFDGDFRDFDNLLMDMAEESAGMDFEIEKSKDGEYTKLEVIDVLG